MVFFFIYKIATKGSIKSPVFKFTIKFDISKTTKEGEKMVTQESVRKKLLDKTNAMRQKNISDSTGIPREMISKFMNNKRELWDSSLRALNDYLDNH